MNSYFQLNPFDAWFKYWRDGLAARDHYLGTAAHTDMLTPFATVKKYGKLSKTLQSRLESFGVPLWDEIMQHAENVQLVVGIGGRTLEKLQNIGVLEGVDIFDNFANATKPEKPWTYSGYIELSNGRRIKTVVWLPYWGGPLQWMDQMKKARFSEFCMNHLSSL